MKPSGRFAIGCAWSAESPALGAGPGLAGALLIRLARFAAIDSRG